MFVLSPSQFYVDQPKLSSAKHIQNESIQMDS
jgi:hypothetical protein